MNKERALVKLFANDMITQLGYPRGSTKIYIEKIIVLLKNG